MSTYIKLIQEVLLELELPHRISGDIVTIDFIEKYYINVYELEWNKIEMNAGSYDEFSSENLSFSTTIYPMQYYNFKMLFKLWFTGNKSVIEAYYDYRDKTDYE